MALNCRRNLRRIASADHKSEQWRGVGEKPLVQGAVVGMVRMREALGQAQHVRCKTRLARMDSAYHLTRTR
jgi:hypothetical protein